MKKGFGGKPSLSKGFTLIELLVVILIVSILAVSVFVALNPVKRFKDARDARRWSDADTILTAIHEYIVDNGGTVPSGIDTSERQLGTDTTGCNATGCTTPPTQASCLNLATTLAPYLKSIPQDPNGGTAGKTYYKVVRDANGIVTVAACASEGGTQISVSR